MERGVGAHLLLQPAVGLQGGGLEPHAAQLVLEREEGGMQIVLKLDFASRAWKLARRKPKPAAS